MNSYKTIALKDGSEFACNRDGEGLFQRRPDGTWGQCRGTGQTPRFTNAQHLSRYVHANIPDAVGKKLPRMVGSSGW